MQATNSIVPFDAPFSSIFDIAPTYVLCIQVITIFFIAIVTSTSAVRTTPLPRSSTPAGGTAAPPTWYSNAELDAAAITLTAIVTSRLRMISLAFINTVYTLQSPRRPGRLWSTQSTPNTNSGGRPVRPIDRRRGQIDLDSPRLASNYANHPMEVKRDSKTPAFSGALRRPARARHRPAASAAPSRRRPAPPARARRRCGRGARCRAP